MVTSHCETITACAAKPTTVTSIINKNSLNKDTISNIDYGMSDDPSITSFLNEQMSSFFTSAFTTTTTSTTSTTTTETIASSTKTSSITPIPSEISYNCDGSSRCKYFPKMRVFYDMAKSFLKDNIIYR
jgi:chitinase